MSKQDWIENTIPRLFELPKVDSVLDVACGLSLKSKFIPAQIRVGVDIYDEYFKYIESDVPHVVIKHDVRRLDEIFMPKSFDLVIAIDIVEHLNKDEAISMIKQCEKIARKAVVIETPEGFIPQNIDILGYGGHEYQTHRSGWSIDDFASMGYLVKSRPYKMTDTKRHSDIDVNSDIMLLDAIKYL